MDLASETKRLCDRGAYAEAAASLAAPGPAPAQRLAGYERLAAALIEAGRTAQAAEALAAAARIEPNGEALDRLGLRLAQATGDAAAALACSERLFVRRPYDRALADDHALLLRAAGRPEAAERAEAISVRHIIDAIELLDNWQEPAAPAADHAIELYLDLLERTVCNWIYADASVLIDHIVAYSEAARTAGRDIPVHAHSMIGRRRLRHLRRIAEAVLAEGIPGDFIETGVWRGGACILLRGVLAAHRVTDRKVIVADSFAGLPPPDPRYAADALTEFTFHLRPELAVDLPTVRHNFDRYGLLDDQVVFLKGFFRDTLPMLPEAPLAILRLDGDLYSSTMDALVHLYDRVSPGGYIVIDDYGVVIDARRATIDFRHDRGIDAPMIAIDGDAIFWRKA